MNPGMDGQSSWGSNPKTGSNPSWDKSRGQSAKSVYTQVEEQNTDGAPSNANA